jgi:hypothetical protein
MMKRVIRARYTNEDLELDLREEMTKLNFQERSLNRAITR